MCQQAFMLIIQAERARVYSWLGVSDGFVVLDVWCGVEYRERARAPEVVEDVPDMAAEFGYREALLTEAMSDIVMFEEHLYV